MASFSKRGNKWRVRFSYKKPDGTFATREKTGFKTKKEAQLFANENEILLSTGKITTTEPQLFAEYFWQWYELYKKKSLRKQTQLSYEQAYRNLKKHFKGVYLQDLDRRQYQLFLNEYGSNHSKESVQKMTGLYHAAIKDAVLDKIISEDFTAGTKKVFNDENTRKIEYLSVDDMKKLIAKIIADRNPKYVSKYMILTALLTGMRPGEIGGLTWNDLNKNFCTIEIKKSWNEKLKDFDALKNIASSRIIRTDRWLLDILDELPKNDPQNRVFGDVPTSTGVNKVLRKLLSDLKIESPGYHFHSCRHSHVAYLLASGIDLYAISKRLGHNDMTITAKVYAYLIDEYKTKTDEKIVSALDNLKPVSPKFAQNNLSF